MSLDILSVYILTCLFAALSPGPGMIAVISYGANHGLRKTLPLMYGLLIGLTIVSMVAASSIGVIIQTSATLFSLLKYAGSMYIAFLGIKILWAPFKEIDVRSEKLPIKSNIQLISQGIVLASANPKTLLFFSSLIPLFIDPKMSTFNQMSVLTFLLLICTFLVHLFYVKLMSMASKIFLKDKLLLLNKLTGIIFVLLAVMIVFKK